jgi:sugar lactone lactonase YvrE
MKAVGVLAVWGVLAVLGGCGGGGDPSTGSSSSGSSAPTTYPVAAAVSGLVTGGSLTLSDNGSDALTITTNGNSVFGTELTSGAAYSVTITTQPSTQVCAITGGSGAISAQSPPAQVSCTGPFLVGGTVSGLNSGQQITLSDNGSDTLTVSANGAFLFPTALKPGSNYAVSIATVPSGQQCSIADASGSISNAVTDVAVSCATPTLSLVAGGLGGTGNIDGPGSAARFNFPTDVALDASGNLYVADVYNQTVRKISPAGLVTTLAGNPGHMGTADGLGSAALFNDPATLAVDPTGNVYVADGGANTIRRITPDGTVTTIAGSPYTSGTADGTGAMARFSQVGGIEMTASGSLLLTDNTRIRSITPAGNVSTVYTGTTQLTRIALESATSVFAGDVTRKAVASIDLTAGTESVLASGFQNPSGICVAPSGTSAAGTLYVSDEFASTVSAVGSGNAVSVLAGVSGQGGPGDGTGGAALLSAPTGLAINSSGILFLADSGNSEVRQITAAGVVTTIAGSAALPGEVDDTGAAARFNYPGAVLADASGNLYVAESAVIRKVTPEGLVTHALSSGVPYPIPLGQAFAMDSAGNFYFAAINTIVMVTPAGVATLVAGNSSNIAGYSDGPAATAAFNHPTDIAFDATGNLYISDTGNFVIRKLAPDGTVSTLAGQQGTPGQADGMGTAAQFTSPGLITVDPTGVLYLVDGNAIRTISAAGVVTTLAGSQIAGSLDGTGAAAQFNGPSGLALASGGAAYVSDTQNHEVRKVTASGVVTTIAGSAGKIGVALGSLPGSLNSPSGIAYVGTTLYIADSGENSVLEITNAP